MDSKTLKEANKINEEIKELEDFIFSAETGKIDLKKIITSGYGAFNRKEFEMNTDIKNKVLNVLYDYLKELKTKLDKL